MNYVKEVNDVINVGKTDEKETINLFNDITKQFHRIFGGVEAEELQANILDIRKNERNYYRSIIDEAGEPYGLTWRQVRYEPKRVKRCETCMNWFYDYSRNGRKLTCDEYGIYYRFDLTNRNYVFYRKNGEKLSVCATEHEQSRRPQPVRRVQEIPFDPQPDNSDAYGNVLLDKIEWQAWENR